MNPETPATYVPPFYCPKCSHCKQYARKEKDLKMRISNRLMTHENTHFFETQNSHFHKEIRFVMLCAAIEYVERRLEIEADSELNDYLRELYVEIKRYPLK
jgi:hypothetical protein